MPWPTLVPLLVGFFVVVCFGLWESYGNVVIPGWSFEPVVREILANTGVASRKVLETEYGLVEDGTNKKFEAV